MLSLRRLCTTAQQALHCRVGERSMNLDAPLKSDDGDRIAVCWQEAPIAMEPFGPR